MTQFRLSYFWSILFVPFRPLTKLLPAWAGFRHWLSSSLSLPLCSHRPGGAEVLQRLSSKVAVVTPLSRSTRSLPKAWFRATTIPVPLPIRMPALVVPVRALGAKPLPNALLRSITVPEAAPTLRMPFPRLPIVRLRKTTVSTAAEIWMPHSLLTLTLYRTTFPLEFGPATLIPQALTAKLSKVTLYSITLSLELISSMPSWPAPVVRLLRMVDLEAPSSRMPAS